MELSAKVLDSTDRLERTLAHELCHVASWVFDHVAKPPHGKVHFLTCLSDRCRLPPANPGEWSKKLIGLNHVDILEALHTNAKPLNSSLNQTTDLVLQVLHIWAARFTAAFPQS